MQPAKRSMSDGAVQRATGRTWDEWFALLDELNASNLTHPEIARLVDAKFGVSGWWAQSVTVEYERARGLRAKHQHSDGFAVSASKTVGVTLSDLYAAWDDVEIRRRWLPSSDFTVTSATRDKAIHISWDRGESRVDVGFYSKGESKSQVALQHSRLKDAGQVEELRAFWRAALGRMSELLTSG